MTLDEFDQAVVDVPPIVWTPAWAILRSKLRREWRREDHPGHDSMIDQLLVPLTEGLLARYLDKIHNHWTRCPNNSGMTIHSACSGANGKRLGDGPSTFQALVAAVINVYHEESRR